MKRTLRRSFRYLRLLLAAVLLCNLAAGRVDHAAYLPVFPPRRVFGNTYIHPR